MAARVAKAGADCTGSTDQMDNTLEQAGQGQAAGARKSEEEEVGRTYPGEAAEEDTDIVAVLAAAEFDSAEEDCMAADNSNLAAFENNPNSENTDSLEIVAADEGARQEVAKDSDSRAPAAAAAAAEEVAEEQKLTEVAEEMAYTTPLQLLPLRNSALTTELKP